MKHPTASADLAGTAGDAISASVDRISALVDELGPNSTSGKLIAGALVAQHIRETRNITPTDMDGDALATFCRAETDMAHEIMDHRVKIDPAAIERLYIPDTRKPWVEPTVTECATTNRRPATLTIAGIDLPNPSAKESDFLRMQAALTNGALATAGLLNAADLIDRQAAEITELQDMLEEAIEPVRLVSEIANMTDFECQLQRVGAIRDAARQKLDGDFTMPRLYGDEDRERAIDVLDDLGVFISLYATALAVDKIAEALGLQRAS